MSTTVTVEKINQILEHKNEANRLIVLTRKKVEGLLPDGAIEYGYNIDPIASTDAIDIDNENRLIYVSVLMTKIGAVNCKIRRRERVIIPFDVYSNSSKDYDTTFFTIQELNDLERIITNESIELMKRVYQLNKMKSELEKMKERI